MEVRIKYFGEVAERTGRTEEKFELDTLTLKSLLERLKDRYDADFSIYKLAIDKQLVDVSEEHAFTSDQTIAILSAFAGG
jgi:molybdopterin converting factor small subunit